MRKMEKDFIAPHLGSRISELILCVVNAFVHFNLNIKGFKIQFFFLNFNLIIYF